MIITFAPVRPIGDPVPLDVVREGDVLTINGTALDFGPLPEGGRLPRAAVDCPWLASEVTREGGVLHLTLVLEHGPIPFPQPPEADVVLYPAPITLTGDGPVALPAYTAPEDDA